MTEYQADCDNQQTWKREAREGGLRYGESLPLQDFPVTNEALGLLHRFTR